MLKLLYLEMIVKKSNLNIHRMYMNVKETRREYEVSNGVVDSSWGIHMIVRKAIIWKWSMILIRELVMIADKELLISLEWSLIVVKDSVSF